jgi:glycosyltransferase involved in cell wall biosynthesis
MKRPHILFVANEVLGWATYSRQLRLILAQRTDIQATVIQRRPPRALMRLARRHSDSNLMKRIRPFDPIRLYAGPMGHAIRHAITENRPDIVHIAAHWPAGAITSMQSDLPYTLALDATRASIGRDLPLAAWSVKDCATEAELCQNAACLFPMSNWARKSLNDDYNIPSARIQVTPPSLASTRWPKPANSANAVPQILFIGNDLKRKGADRLARWVNGPLSGSCHLHIVSTDSTCPPQGPDITFHGAVAHDHLMSDLIPQMDVFCLPTLLDMSPFVLVEAAAAGLPIVASDLGGIADLVDTGKSGILVPPTDEDGFIAALSTLIEDKQLRQKMGQRAREIAAERFDADRNFGALINRLVEIATARTAVK